ncbi:MAG: DUF6492 family protein [Polyangiales bacterium]
MDAVLPLVARDCERAVILLRSLRRNFAGLRTLWVVVPLADVDFVRRTLGALGGAWQLRVVPEDEVVPELAYTRALRGWYRQQLVKLAIAELIATTHYLTFDADVICVRPTTPEALAPDGKGLCHIIQSDAHADWYLGSRAVLGLPREHPRGLHNVTPAVLSREAVLSLQHHLASRAEAGKYRRGLPGLHQRWHALRAAWQGRLGAPQRTWCTYLIGGAPWTEYALYYSHLEATQQLATHHTLTPHCIYAIERSVWRADRHGFDSWDPRPLFDGQGAPYFAIIQSNTRLAPERVWQKLAPFLAPHAP